MNSIRVAPPNPSQIRALQARAEAAFASWRESADQVLVARANQASVPSRFNDEYFARSKADADAKERIYRAARADVDAACLSCVRPAGRDRIGQGLPIDPRTSFSSTLPGSRIPTVVDGGILSFTGRTPKNVLLNEMVDRAVAASDAAYAAWQQALGASLDASHVKLANPTDPAAAAALTAAIADETQKKTAYDEAKAYANRLLFVQSSALEGLPRSPPPAPSRIPTGGGAPAPTEKRTPANPLLLVGLGLIPAAAAMIYLRTRKRRRR